MREIVINLTLVFTVPEKMMNINGLLMGLREAIPQIFIALLGAIVQAIEEHPRKSTGSKPRQHLLSIRPCIGMYNGSPKRIVISPV